MPKECLAYLQREHSRLSDEFDLAISRGASCDEVARIEMLRRLVDDQVERWARDLADDREAT